MSKLTLAFVARRLQAESLVIVFGARPEGAVAHAFDGIPTLELGGLSVQATTELLSTTSGSTVDPDVGRRVAAGTQGCPLAVVELCSVQDQLAGGNVLRALRGAEATARSMKNVPPSMATLTPAKPAN